MTTATMKTEEQVSASENFEVLENVTNILADYDFLPSDEARLLPAEIIQRLGKAKAFGLCAKKKHSGAELSIAQANSVIARAATFDASVASALVIHNFLSLPCVEGASGLEGYDSILTRAASGEALCAFALTEHGAGSAPRHISATATMTEVGYRITGTKIWIGLGAWASNLICFAKVPDKGNRIAAFLVDSKSEGFSVQVEHKTMGLRGIVQNTLSFKDVLVSFDKCLSGNKDGYRVAKYSMNKGRLGVAAMSLGTARRVTQIVTYFVSQRKIGNSLLIENSYIQKRIGELVQRIDCMNRILRFAESVPQHLPLAEYMSTVAKVICSEWANEIVDHALQLLGGRGYEEDLIVAKMYRDVRIMRIFEGPTEALLVHLERNFSSRATSLLVEEAFAQIGGEALYSRLVTLLAGDHSKAAGREAYRGWAIALSLALGACHADRHKEACERGEMAEGYLAKRLKFYLDMVGEHPGQENVGLRHIISEFIASANESIRKPNFDSAFMAVKNFS